MSFEHEHEKKYFLSLAHDKHVFLKLVGVNWKQFINNSNEFLASAAKINKHPSPGSSNVLAVDGLPLPAYLPPTPLTQPSQPTRPSERSPTSYDDQGSIDPNLLRVILG